MIYLERTEPTSNLYRFYALEVSPTLFGQWALIRRWGRIGSKGQKLEQWFEDPEEAKNQGERLRDAKERKGYKPLNP